MAICCSVLFLEFSVYLFEFITLTKEEAKLWMNEPCNISDKIIKQNWGIIWTNLVVLEDAMLHTKFQGHRPLDFREEDF